MTRGIAGAAAFRRHDLDRLQTVGVSIDRRNLNWLSETMGYFPFVSNDNSHLSSHAGMRPTVGKSSRHVEIRCPPPNCIAWPKAWAASSPLLLMDVTDFHGSDGRCTSRRHRNRSGHQLRWDCSDVPSSRSYFHPTSSQVLVQAAALGITAQQNLCPKRQAAPMRRETSLTVSPCANAFSNVPMLILPVRGLVMTMWISFQLIHVPAIATYRLRGAHRSSSVPRIIGTHVPPIWVLVTVPAFLSALAVSRLGRPISTP